MVTQFPADADGKMTQYRRFYIQDGKLIDNAPVQEGDFAGQNFMDDPYCEHYGAERYMDLGATAGMGEALDRGMVLAFSIWWDESEHMNWLDGVEDGVGPCEFHEGDPENIRVVQPDTSLIYSKMKWGELGSTYEYKCKSKPKRKI